MRQLSADLTTPQKLVGSRAACIGVLAYCTIVLAVVAVFSSDDWIRSHLWALYALQYIIVVWLVVKQEDRWLFIMSPSFVTVSYMAINNCLGAYFFSMGVVTPQENYQSYLEWTNLGWIAAFFLCANLVVLLPYLLTKKASTSNPRKVPCATNTPLAEKVKVIVIGFFGVVILFFSALELDLSVLGGVGNFSIIPKTLAALLIVLVLVKSRQRGRFAVYLLILLYFASFSSEDKRDAIFLIAPVLLIECLSTHRVQLRPRHLILAAGFSVVCFVLILMMSIYRGYGEFHPKSFLDTRHYLIEYVEDPDFYKYLGNNMEFNYLFFHSHQAIEYVYNSSDILLYGSTFLKPLFFTLPRDLFPNKPQSIVHHYTNYHDPQYRAAGGSWAITMYADFFWNFHVLGLLVFLPVFYLINRCYLILAYSIRQQGVNYYHLLPLFAYQHFLTLIRGEGFDIYFGYLIVAAVFAFAFFLPMLEILKTVGRQENRHPMLPTLTQCSTDMALRWTTLQPKRPGSR